MHKWCKTGQKILLIIDNVELFRYLCEKMLWRNRPHTHTHRSGSAVLLVGGIGCLVWGCVCVHSVCWCVFIKRSDESGQLKPWTSRMDLSTHVQHGFKDKVRFSRLSFWFSLCVCSYCGLVFTSSSSLYSFSNVRLSAVSPLNIPTHLNRNKFWKVFLYWRILKYIKSVKVACPKTKLLERFWETSEFFAMVLTICWHSGFKFTQLCKVPHGLWNNVAHFDCLSLI